MPASEWHQVRKDAAGAEPAEVVKAVTSESVAESGKTQAGHIAGREFPGQRVKVPPIDDAADTTEEIALPRKSDDTGNHRLCSCAVQKCGCGNKIKEEDSASSKCKCEVGKCNCTTIKDEEAEKASAEVEKAIEPYKQPSKPGVMLALAIPGDLAKKLKQDGGMEPEDMHVTLGYYGKLGDDVDEPTLEAMRKCVMKQVVGYKPIKAAIGGLGRFNATKSSDDKDVLIGLVDSPDLHDVRESLIQAVAKCNMAVTKDGASEPAAPTGPQVRKDHGYTPHITLGYIDQGDQLSVHKLPREEFTFTHLLMQVGKDKVLYALGEEQNVTKSIWMPIVKADEDQRLATGIVLQPEIVDAQGDIISAEVIRHAAHNFLALYNKKTQLGLQHEMMKPDGVELVESWIAPVDMVLNNRPILAGTWMMTLRIKNDVLWNKVKTGVLSGLSIGGVAKVRRLVA